MGDLSHTPSHTHTHTEPAFSIAHSFLSRRGQSAGAGSTAPGKWQEKSLRVSFLKLWTFYFDSSLCCRALYSCHQIWPKLPLIKVICLANFQHMSSTATFTKPRTTCMIQVLFCLLTDSYQIWHNMISFKNIVFLCDRPTSNRIGRLKKVVLFKIMVSIIYTFVGLYFVHQATSIPSNMPKLFSGSAVYAFFSLWKVYM